MDYDLRKESDVKEFLDKLSIEYRFSCFSEKKPDGCHLLGDYLETVKKDYEKAAKVFRTNCDDHNFARSCMKFGHYCYLGKGVKQDNEQALSYYEKGCKAGDNRACTNGGLMLLSDRKKSNLPDVSQVDKYRQGRNLLDTACTNNDNFACYYLSGIYIQGIEGFLARDMTEAFKYSQKACDLGNIYACGNLSQMYGKGEGVEKNEKNAEFYKTKALNMQREYKEKIALQRGAT